MKQKKIPMRTCVVTKEKYPKMELIRIVRTPSNEIVIDLKGKTNGRGAYLKKDKAVFEKAKKTKILNKVSKNLVKVLLPLKAVAVSIGIASSTSEKDGFEESVAIENKYLKNVAKAILKKESIGSKGA